MTQGSIVVTGASSGIGRTCALHLHKLGFHIFAGVRKGEDGDALLRLERERLTPLLIDITDGNSIAAATRAFDDRPLAGLVNNAGINVSAPVELLPLDALRRQLEVNVIGQVAAIQAFLPALRRARGRIVNIGSISGLVSAPSQGPYSASKFALEAINDALRMELAPWGIQVALIEPGAIRTPIWDKSVNDAARLLRGVPPEKAELYGKLLDALFAAASKAADRAIAPEAVARSVAHALTSSRPKTRYVVGRDARLQKLIRHLPDRWRDRIILKFLGA